MCRDALQREESCGGHFREEHQTAEGKLNGMMKILHSLEHGNIRVTKMNLNYTRNLLSTKR